MVEKDYKKIASDILANVGGTSNVTSASNCITRLRIIFKDINKINQDSLRKVDSVMQIMIDGSLLMVVLGPGTVQRVATEFNELLKSAPAATTEVNKEPQKSVTQQMSINDDWRQNKQKMKDDRLNRFAFLTRFMRHLANIFSSLMPAIIAAGLFAAMKAIITQFGLPGGKVDDAATATLVFYYISSIFAAGFNSYLVLAVGYNTAKEFGGTPVLGLMLGGICLGGTAAAVIAESGKAVLLTEIDKLAKIIGLSEVLKAGGGGIFGVMVAAWLLCVFEKFLRKHIPASLSTIVVPFISILVVGCVYVFGIMIVTGYVADGIALAIEYTFQSNHVIVRIIMGYIAAALFLPLVTFGMHQILVAIQAQIIVDKGVTYFFPALAMAGAGQVGAAVALYIKAKKRKNTQLQRNITSAIVPGILGVGEPLIYSVTLPLGSPFITAGLGAGIGGAFVTAFRLGATAPYPSGILGIPLVTYVGENQNIGMGYGLFAAGLILAALGGFLFTWFFIKEDKAAPKVETANA